MIGWSGLRASALKVPPPHVIQSYFLSGCRVARVCRNNEICVVSLHAGLGGLEPGLELTEVALVGADPWDPQEENLLLGPELEVPALPLDMVL